MEMCWPGNLPGCYRALGKRVEEDGTVVEGVPGCGYVFDSTCEKVWRSRRR